MGTPLSSDSWLRASDKVIRRCAAGEKPKQARARNGQNAKSTAVRRSETIRARRVTFGGKETEHDLPDWCKGAVEEADGGQFCFVKCLQ